MVDRIITIFVLVPLEQRKVHHPEKLKAFFIIELQVSCDFTSQRRQRFVSSVFLIGNKQNQLAILCIKALDYLLLQLRGEEFGDAAGKQEPVAIFTF